jgi:hypothetical protein
MTIFPAGGGMRSATAIGIDERRIFALFVAGFVVSLTLFAALSHGNLSSSTNMVENWIWGQEFQLGYFKHPPFYAWVVGAWFRVFPRVDWAYFLLAETAVAVGLVGVWRAIGLVDRGERRLVAAVLPVLTPLVAFHALTFNANTISIATWPWAIWAFLAALERPTAWNGLRLGALLGLAMLGKYYSATLVLSMLVVVALEPERRRLFLSPAAIAATLTAMLVIAPNIAWVVAHDYAPFVWAGHARDADTWRTLVSIATFPVAHLLYLVPIVLGVAVATGLRGAATALRGVFRTDGDRWRRRFLILGFGPFVATMVFGIAAFSRLPALWGEPLWMFSGWILLSAPGLTVGTDERLRLHGVAAALGTILVAAAPTVAALQARGGDSEATMPLAEIAAEADDAWHDIAGTARFSIVGGDLLLAGSVSFYAPETPSGLQDFDFAHSPWIDEARLDHDGALAVCRSADTACLAEARALFGPRIAESERVIAKIRDGVALAPMEVTFLVRPPATVPLDDPRVDHDGDADDVGQQKR